MDMQGTDQGNEGARGTSEREPNQEGRKDGVARSSGWAGKWLAPTVVVAVVMTIVGALVGFGEVRGRLGGLEDRMTRLEGRLDALISDVQRPVASERAHAQEPGGPLVFDGGQFGSGYHLGVSSSGRLTGWATVSGGEMCMSYPPGQEWGAISITVGSSTQELPRPGRDLSEYSSLELEVRGVTGGESVEVGLKDSMDPDDGSETKILLRDLSQSWETHVLPLEQFVTADLTRLYVVTEFVFSTNPETVCVRRIRFVP